MRRYLKTVLILAMLVMLPGLAGADYWHTTASGNWSTQANWFDDTTSQTGTAAGRVPGNGDSVEIKNSPFTVDVDTTVGLSSAQWLAGTGTMTNASSGVTINTSADLTSQLHVGDQFTANGGTHTALAITATTVTIGANVNFASVSYAFTYSPRAIYVSVANGILNVANGKRLIARGDVVFKQSSITLGTLNTTGAYFRFDSSLATGTPIYRIILGAGEQNSFVGSFIAYGASGSRSLVDTAAGSGVGVITNAATGANNAGTSIASTINCQYTDFVRLGSVAFDASSLVVGMYCAGQAAGQGMQLDHVTWSACGPVTTGSTALAATSSYTFCQLKDCAVTTNAPFSFINLNDNVGTATGTRVFTDNVIQLPMNDIKVSWIGNPSNYTVARNMFNQTNSLDWATNIQNFASIDSNFWYARYLDSTTNGWCFLGLAGDTISNGIFLNDEGAAQLNEHQLMPVDGLHGISGSTWRLTGEVFERVGPTPANSWDLSHIGGVAPTGVPMTFVYDHILSLPMSDGSGSGHIRARGDNPQNIYNIHHNTLVANPYVASNLNDGAVLFGSKQLSFVGSTDELALLQDNISYQLTAGASSGPGTSGYLAAYSRSNATGQVPNVLTAAGVSNNYSWNGTVGTGYNASGVSQGALGGLDYFWQTTQPAASTAINPGFVDVTRNTATFDTAYLGNTATPWANAHLYNIGDIASASTSTFYGGVTINFRCIATHTSSAASATNGKPGSLTTQGPTGGGALSSASYRLNWEFESVDRIRQAILVGTKRTDAALGLVNADYIKTCWTWIRAGFAPTNAALHNTDHTGTADVGAIAYQPVAARFRRNPGRRQGTRSLALLDTPFSDLLAEETSLCVLH